MDVFHGPPSRVAGWALGPTNNIYSLFSVRYSSFSVRYSSFSVRMEKKNLCKSSNTAPKILIQCSHIFLPCESLESFKLWKHF